MCSDRGQGRDTHRNCQQLVCEMEGKRLRWLESGKGWILDSVRKQVSSREGEEEMRNNPEEKSLH